MTLLIDNGNDPLMGERSEERRVGKECQLAGVPVLIFFIGTRAELATPAKAKTRVSEALLRELSIEGILLSCKGMQ